MSANDFPTRIRDRILDLAVQGREGHIGSSFSIVEILIAVLLDPDVDQGPERWRERLGHFVLSKGHAALALYALMRESGALSDDDLRGFAERGSRFGGHPTKIAHLGIPVSTGSLGHGLPMCCGMAFAARQRGNARRFVCVVGDGEINEGSVWESLLLARKFDLSNLTIVVDDNGSSTRAVDLGDIVAKFASFGFYAQDAPGHDVVALRAALARAAQSSRPSAIVARTTKGFGSTVTRSNFAWHHRVPTAEEVIKIRQGYGT